MDLTKAIQVLRDGGTILYPSDTIWGIGCDATNDEACQKVFELKNRPANKSFIILVDSFAMIERYIPEFPEVCYDLADLAVKPLTIIYPNATGLAKSILGEDGSIGIRLTKDPICLQLIRGMRKPLVSTSANLSGEASPKSYKEISAEIKKGVDEIVQERTSEIMATPSQIIKIGIGGDVEIIRK